MRGLSSRSFGRQGEVDSYKLSVVNCEGVRNRIDIIDKRTCSYETLGLDSGVRRRDEFEASSLIVIPAPYQVRGRLQPESSGTKEEFDVYTIMALLVRVMSRIKEEEVLIEVNAVSAILIH
jgi:hypothetical protein